MVTAGLSLEHISQQVATWQLFVRAVFPMLTVSMRKLNLYPGSFPVELSFKLLVNLARWEGKQS